MLPIILLLTQIEGINKFELLGNVTTSTKEVEGKGLLNYNYLSKYFEYGFNIWRKDKEIGIKSGSLVGRSNYEEGMVHSIGPTLYLDWKNEENQGEFGLLFGGKLGIAKEMENTKITCCVAGENPLLLFGRNYRIEIKKGRYTTEEFPYWNLEARMRIENTKISEKIYSSAVEFYAKREVFDDSWLGKDVKVKYGIKAEGIIPGIEFGTKKIGFGRKKKKIGGWKIENYLVFNGEVYAIREGNEWNYGFGIGIGITLPEKSLETESKKKF